jgi:alkylhydroperoxidase family enzyme
MDVRIPQLDLAEWSSELNDLYQDHVANHPITGRGKSGDVQPSGLVRILARHPGLYQAWTDFAGALHQVRRLPERDKELAILRVAWRNQAPYEWGQHVPRALEFGVSHDEVARVKIGPDDPGWVEFDRSLLQAVDELHDEGTITDATWAVLSERYDDAQLIELPIVIGFYHLMAFMLNSLAVPIKEGAQGFDAG